MNQREYETICVVKPDVQGDVLKQLEDKIKKVFATHKVENITKKDWGNKTLAYPIQKFKTAQYFQYIYTATGDLVSDLEKNLGYEESVLRYLTVLHDRDLQKKMQKAVES